METRHILFKCCRAADKVDSTVVQTFCTRWIDTQPVMGAAGENDMERANG